MIFCLQTEQDEKPEKIIKEKICGISIYNRKDKTAYYVELKEEILTLKEIFENEKIRKTGINLSKKYILLRQEGIILRGIENDIEIGAYILNPTDNKLNLKKLAMQYLEIDVGEYIGEDNQQQQLTLFQEENIEKDVSKKFNLYAYLINEINEEIIKKLKETNSLELYKNIDIPTIEVLSDMQWNGMYVDEQELNKFGQELTSQIEVLTKIIHEMAGEEFNINSTKQLGEILFEKMNVFFWFLDLYIVLVLLHK